MAAELPLAVSAASLAVAAIVLTLATRDGPWRSAGMVVVAVGALAPPLLGATAGAVSATGAALWEWSAAGGPTIRAAYRIDGLGLVGVTLATAYAGAALFAATRPGHRHALLPAPILALGLVAIAAAVVDDLIAGTVLLAVIAALTVIALLVVAPLPATARAATFFALGIQSWILAALLIARRGAPDLELSAMSEGALSSGAVLAASVGAVFFAGLYPVVPWSFERAASAPERERLRGLLTMPAGIAASLLLLRTLGAQGRSATIALPEIPVALHVVLALAAGALLALRLLRRPLRAEGIVVPVALLLMLFAYPFLHWGQLALISALLTVIYAAVVSLAVSEEWDVVRYDVALGALWLALVLGTTASLGAAFLVLVGEVAGALSESVMLAPHRAYMALVGSATVITTGMLGLGLGALTAGDPLTVALALLAAGALLLLELAQVARRFRAADVPADLEVAAAVGGVMGTVLLMVVGTPLVVALGPRLGSGAPVAVPVVAFVVAMAASALVVGARAARPLVPYLEAAAERAQRTAAALDPVPAGVAAFRVIDVTASRASALFVLFEQRAGVWLATIVIVALLVWSVR